MRVMSGPIDLPFPLPRPAFPAAEALREQRREVFDACVRGESDRLYRLACRLTGRAADAEDLLQEAFLRGWRAIDRFRGESELSTWLYRIILNLSRNRRRRDTEALPEVPGPGAEPTDALARRDLLSRVMAEVDALPRRQREALLLRAAAGLGYREIAGVMRITDVAVKSHLAQARKRLAARFPGEVRP
jgi:RNA polymerase sigma-70 factor, ECF subfamily